MELGFSPRSAVVFIYLFTLSLGISAIMLSNDRATEAFLAVLQAADFCGNRDTDSGGQEAQERLEHGREAGRRRKVRK